MKREVHRLPEQGRRVRFSQGLSTATDRSTCERPAPRRPYVGAATLTPRAPPAAALPPTAVPTATKHDARARAPASPVTLPGAGARLAFGAADGAALAVLALQRFEDAEHLLGGKVGVTSGASRAGFVLAGGQGGRGGGRSLGGGLAASERSALLPQAVERRSARSTLRRAAGQSARRAAAARQAASASSASTRAGLGGGVAVRTQRLGLRGLGAREGDVAAHESRREAWPLVPAPRRAGARRRRRAGRSPARSAASASSSGRGAGSAPPRPPRGAREAKPGRRRGRTRHRTAPPFRRRASIARDAPRSTRRAARRRASGRPGTVRAAAQPSAAAQERARGSTRAS